MAGLLNPYQATPPTKQKAMNAQWRNGQLVDAQGNVVMQAPGLLDAASQINQFLPVTGDIQAGLLAANDVKQGNYGSAALNSLGLLPFVPAMGATVGKAAKTKYELAHEIAQKNAVEMLGLPPNNTAMDRAKAMGYDQPAYTGVNTSGEIDEMLPKSWFSEQEKYASDYSNVIPRSGINAEPRVYPVMLKTGKVSSKQYTGLYDDMENALSKKRTNTFKVENVGGGSNNFYVTKDPSQIRSRFAAFDPARAHEADLLGYADPRLLGLMALGTAGGIGAVNYMNNK